MRTARLAGALGLAVATTLAAPALPLEVSVPGISPAPASAAACTGAGGVTVVVDYNGLGGGVSQGCVTGGGRVARSLFTAAGARMEDVRNEPGFVCRVNLEPGPEACGRVPANGDFWSLWWSSGDGRWNFSNDGVDLLTVPDGGFVAWSWTRQAPSAPARRPVAPPPSGGDPGGSGGSGGSGSSGGGGGDTSGGADRTDPGGDAPGGTAPGGAGATDGGSGTPGAGRGAGPDGERSGRPARRDGAGPGAPGDGADRRGRDGRQGRARPDRSASDPDPSTSSPLTDADGEADVVSDASEEGPSGLPTWVPFVVLGVFALGGAGAVLVRRRQRGSA